MPRQARVIVPETAHHIVQRGHNRQAVFVEPADYRYYLATLQEWKQTLSVRVYAYCLMTNHVHLILAPGPDPTTMGRLMKRLAGRQTRYVNRLEGRTGSLWEGRYKSSPIETERYLLACCRYVELNPVRAGLLEWPEEYPWSSYRQKLGMENSWVDEDACYRGLAEDLSERRYRYRRFVMRTDTEAMDDQIRAGHRHGWLTGTSRFADEIEKKTGIRIENRTQGRPRTQEDGPEK